VAVVSISKIQIRRGKKYSDTGLPQLASGELGWAIDSQELYIGNGSVAEGAPFVGNTKILTETDNIFNLVGTYTYLENNNISGTVARSLQDRLDDRVSVRAFGMAGNGGDISDKLEQAIQSLYITPSVSLEESRITLYFEAGIYTISRPITLPSYVSFEGAGKDKTIIEYTGEETMFNTSISPSDSYSTQPRYISIKGMTFNFSTESSIFNLNSVRDSVFEDLRFTSTWRSTDNDNPMNKAINSTSLSQMVLTQRNLFRNIDFYGVSYGIFSNHNFQHNTIENCTFDDVYRAINLSANMQGYLGLPGHEFGASDNTFNNNRFILVDAEGLVVKFGKRNNSIHNKFYNVGNDGGTNETATYPAITFAESGNMSTDDFFERSVDMGTLVEGLGTEFIPNVSGELSYKESFYNSIEIPQLVVPALIFRTGGGPRGTVIIRYHYRSTLYEFTREGILTIAYNSISPTNRIAISDEYQCTGRTDIERNLQFNAVVANSGTIEVNASNIDQGNMVYTVEYINSKT